VELFAQLLSLRAKGLELGMKRLLGDNSPLFAQFWSHGLVASLRDTGHPEAPPGDPKAVDPNTPRSPKRTTTSIPAYMDAHLFALVITDLYRAAQTDSSLKGVLDEIEHRLGALFAEANNDVVRLRALLERHFDECMTRIEGWYKRRARAIALLMALVIAASGNVDTIQIAKLLSGNSTLRDAMVKRAESIVNTERDKHGSGAAGAPDLSANAAAGYAGATPAPAQDPVRNVVSAGQQFASEYANAAAALSPLQLGWNVLPVGWHEWLAKVIGLIVSAFAISLGAPFWFDVLQRFMSVRTSGTPPDEKKPKKS
jgi:hypothetical protein